MGIDVYVKNGIDEVEIGTCRGDGYQFWRELFPDIKYLGAGTKFPFSMLMTRIEEEVKKFIDSLTREELVEYYISGDKPWFPENSVIEIYKKIRYIKGNEEGYEVVFR